MYNANITIQKINAFFILNMSKSIIYQYLMLIPTELNQIH